MGKSGYYADSRLPEMSIPRRRALPYTQKQHAPLRPTAGLDYKPAEAGSYR